MTKLKPILLREAFLELLFRVPVGIPGAHADWAQADIVRRLLFGEAKLYVHYRELANDDARQQRTRQLLGELIAHLLEEPVEFVTGEKRPMLTVLLELVARPLSTPRRQTTTPAPSREAEIVNYLRTHREWNRKKLDQEAAKHFGVGRSKIRELYNAHKQELGRPTREQPVAR